MEQKQIKVVKVKEEIHREIKSSAAKQGIKLETLINSILKEWIKTNK